MQVFEIRWKILFAGVAAAIFSGGAAAGFEEDYEAQKWEEIEVQLPATPKRESLVPFYVSAATENRFFVDASSIAVGTDGVVRYTLVIETAGGVRNVSFEGMRCETKERRLYAFGRRDGTWSKSRSNQWGLISGAGNNAYHATLYAEYFCPVEGMVRTADEAREAFRRGGRLTPRGS